MSTLRIISSSVRRFLLQWAAGRSFVLTLVAGQLVTPLIGLAVWTTALPGRPQLSSYYVALLVVQLLTVSYEQHTFSGRIYNGELADDLLRPHPVILHPLSENLALRLWHLLMGLPLVLVVALSVPLQLDWLALAASLPALLLAALLRFLFTYVLALSAFWTERANGVVGLGETLIFLLGGVAAPVSLLPEPLRLWGAALPFRAMHGFPAELAAGHLAAEQQLAGYAVQLLWIGVFAALAVLTWRAGVRRYTAVGG